MHPVLIEKDTRIVFDEGTVHRFAVSIVLMRKRTNRAVQWRINIDRVGALSFISVGRDQGQRVL